MSTALISSAFRMVWVHSLTANPVNLGLIRPREVLTEAVFETIEIPIAMIAGAEMYEGQEKQARNAG